MGNAHELVGTPKGQRRATWAKAGWEVCGLRRGGLTQTQVA